tara:strand:+ start:1118 stop:1597 length:480 start_codon:yes stop_codon:yes gene_type:complete
MKKTLKIDFFSNSKKWSRRLPKIKKIGLMTIKIMNKYFSKNHMHYINLILSDKEKVSKLNSKFNKIYKDTDVLTFVTKISNKELGKILYCDIFFSIDTIESFIKKNDITLYDHFNHLLIHSFLHINGYDHKNLTQFNKMKKEEVKILNKFNISDPYRIQ